MKTKKKLAEENLEELSKRIGLLVKQYNLLAESEDIYIRLMLVNSDENNIGNVNKSNEPIELYDLVKDYNDARGWSSSSSNC